MANNRNLTQEPQKGKPVKLVKIMREKKKWLFQKMLDFSKATNEKYKEFILHFHHDPMKNMTDHTENCN